MNRLFFLPLIFVAKLVAAQSFAPAPGQPGSTAIHRDSSLIVNWADRIAVVRGYLDIQNTNLGFASFGLPEDALGIADGNTVVSLGDSGVAILQFPFPIQNGVGPDFAVFENGFADDYMEFAFVEVSSDGLNYVRFPATSEVPTDVQLTNFSFSNCRYVNNLAGKYRANYGTPFDLEELAGYPGLDLNNITHVRLIDVIGSIDSEWGTMDQFGTLINDPYPTSFESGGFDLDAVAVLNQNTAGLEIEEVVFNVYPNPVTSFLIIESNGTFFARLLTLEGQQIHAETGSNKHIIDVSELAQGIYMLHLYQDSRVITYKFVK